MKRKHIDWEIYSSMFDGKINKKSGIIVITLPSISSKYFDVAHGEDEKQLLYPGITSWKIIDNRSEYEERYPHLPARIIDNLLSKNSRISVTNWDRIVGNWKALEFLINCAYASKEIAEYDLSRPMRRRDS